MKISYGGHPRGPRVLRIGGAMVVERYAVEVEVHIYNMLEALIWWGFSFYLASVRSLA